MSTGKALSFDKQIKEYIKAGIEKEAAKVAESYKEQMLKDLDKAVSDVAAKVALRLSRTMSVLNKEDSVIIEVRKEL